MPINQTQIMAHSHIRSSGNAGTHATAEANNQGTLDAVSKVSSQKMPTQTVFAIEQDMFQEGNMKDLELYQIDSLGMAAEDYKGLLVEE